jgi:hypothetical protein
MGGVRARGGPGADVAVPATNHYATATSPGFTASVVGTPMTRLGNATGRRRLPDDDLSVHDLSANRRRSPSTVRSGLALCAGRR